MLYLPERFLNADPKLIGKIQLFYFETFLKQVNTDYFSASSHAMRHDTARRLLFKLTTI